MQNCISIILVVVQPAHEKDRHRHHCLRHEHGYPGPKRNDKQTNPSRAIHDTLYESYVAALPHSNHRHCIRTTCSSGRSDDDDDEEREYVECLRNTTPRVSSERSHDDEEREYDECLRNTTPSYTTANTPRIS